MSEMVMCKSCGFVMEKGKWRDLCPACGVPAKLFIPYEERIAPMRKLILSLDIHPVMVHFPQAFTATILLLSLAALLVRGTWFDHITSVIYVLGHALPVVVLVAVAAGILDAKVRFRKVTTPLLKKKMFVGVLFFLFATGILFCIRSVPVMTSSTFILIAFLSAGAMACGTILGLWGVKLLNAKFPG